MKRMELHSEPTRTPSTETSAPAGRSVGTLDSLLTLAEQEPGDYELIAFGRGNRVTWRKPDLQGSPTSPDSTSIESAPPERSVGTLDDLLTLCERTRQKAELLEIRRGGRVTWQRSDVRSS